MPDSRLERIPAIAKRSQRKAGQSAARVYSRAGARIIATKGAAVSDEFGHIVTDAMRARIGVTTPAVPLPDPIGDSDVRKFMAVTGDTNQMYRDDTVAQSLGFERRVVPQMLVTQLFRHTDSTQIDAVPHHAWHGLQFPPDYTNNRNAGHEFTWLKPVYVGDQLTVQQRLKDVYARHNRAGVAVIYVVRESEIRNQKGEVVVRQTSTLAKMPARPRGAGKA
jgi:acyl dehydratase